MNLSEEQILALAPDEASKKAGKDLARSDKWVSYGADTAAVWGECQGSGSKPYQTQVDAQNIAFKCSCPSRKFPCKHGLGLLLLNVKNPSIFTIREQPDWVREWLGKRTEKAEKVADVPPKQVDEVAQAKRQQARLKKVDEGVEDLLLWIKDIIRNGLISVPGKESALQQMARRMVDAQAPGLAGIIKSFEDINFYKDGWQGEFLDKLLTMYLLVSGYRNMEKMTPELQKEIRALIGFPQNLDEIRAQDGVKDDWFVLGKQVKEDDLLTIERNWLYGLRTQRYALILNFYVNNQVKDVPLAPGSTIDGELVFFNSGLSLRALLKQRNGIKKMVQPEGLRTWKEVMESQSGVYERNPFVAEMPFIVEELRPVFHNEQWWLQDRENDVVQMKLQGDGLWKYLAVSGGAAGTLSLVGKENEYTPLGTWHKNKYVTF